MKLIIVSLGLFFSMKIVYGFWGDYNSDYWSVVYYIFHYVMMTSFLRYVYLMGESVLERRFFLVGLIYFAALLMLHLICLFKIELYRQFVAGAGYFGVGIVVLTIGILTIQYKLRRKPCQKNLKKNSYSS